LVKRDRLKFIVHFYIHRDVLGSVSHVCVQDDNQFSVDEIPDDAWVLLINEQHANTRCLRVLCRLVGIVLNDKPSAPHVRAMQIMLRLTPTALVPWQKVLPKNEYDAFVQNIIVQCAAALSDDVAVKYYTTVWTLTTNLLAKFEPAYIDRNFLQALTMSAKNKHMLKAFEPNDLGYILPPVYDRFGTRTGRLTIHNGPNVLILKKDYRSIFCSKWGVDGSIVMLDFAQLEPRIVLYEAGRMCLEIDLYSSLNKEIFGEKIDRSVVKTAIIAQLYGISKDVVAKRLNVTHYEISTFTKKISLFFKTSELLQRVKQQYLKSGFIRNRYGRRIAIDEPVNRIFLNSYVQSTATDVAMIGFYDIVKGLSSLVRPMFVVHDALFVDCHNSVIDEFLGYKWIKVPGYVQRFVIKGEKLSVHDAQKT